jgi:N-acetyl-beta-hexosaminidase
MMASCGTSTSLELETTSQSETDVVVEEISYNILHLDAGRKYFSPDVIMEFIDLASESGYNQLELYLSDNQGFRFALDDMTITTSSTYDLAPALGDGYDDGSKYPDYSGKYLTQTEMDGIIAYAKEKEIDIVPCINTPGHMGAILEEFPQFCYEGSRSSIDLENQEAVDFALAIVDKYASYFSSRGVEYFNLGADEYANDMANMGFEGLYHSGKYQLFVDYLNESAEIVLDYGMTPRAFNDGIYYEKDISVEINKEIQVCYWSSGWWGYDLAPAYLIAGQGHDMINTHGDYYWILGGYQCTADKAKGFKKIQFMGSTIRKPAGSMFCIWCDVANVDGADDGVGVLEDAKEAIKAFGEAIGK